MNKLSRLWQSRRNALPPETEKSVVEWSRKHVRLIGSARSETFDPDITPWTKEPLECANDGTRKMTYVKPIQSGGSVAGECAICFKIANSNGGDIQYNWQNNEKADDRFTKRIDKILRACKPVMDRYHGDMKKWKSPIAFPHLNFIMQGVYTDGSVASDSICFQVNEELHDQEGGWFPGRLKQAHGRLTAYWNSVAFQISNAGKIGSQLHQALESGTHQHWQVKCPGCGLYHQMRTRWEDKRPDLGGLRYDAKGCERKDGQLDYNKLIPSIRYQMPCGYEVHEAPRERRALSLSGKYSEPTNTGALLTERSYTLDAVSIDYIPWLNLIQEKHDALRAMKRGDSALWWTYLRERECQFIDDSKRPIIHNIILSEKKKDRAGLKNRKARFAAVDRQRGVFADGELPHWWMVIADAAELEDGRIHVLIIFEGKLETEQDVIGTIIRHEVQPTAVVVDSTWDSMNVYQLCLSNGYNAIRGSPQSSFSHEGGALRIFSVEKPLHTMISGRPPVHKYQLIQISKTSRQGEWKPDPREPMFWHYSKAGIRDRFAWVRTSKHAIFEVPSDVTEDFESHLDAERFEPRENARTGETVGEWVQHKRRNDLFVCCCYISMQMDMTGLIGAGVIEPTENKQEEK